MAYDPIVEGMFKALGIEAPTYVDDLAGLINGPKQPVRAPMYLIWASWAAGLEVSTHTCRRLTYPEDSPSLRYACANLPVKTWTDADGRRHVTGLPPAPLRALIGKLLPDDRQDAQETRIECSCAITTALVPKHKHEAWRAVMEATPFGGSSVQATWPYLGAAVTSMSRDEDLGQGTDPERGAATADSRTNNHDRHRDDGTAAQQEHQPCTDSTLGTTPRQTTLLEIGAFVARNNNTDDQPGEP